MTSEQPRTGIRFGALATILLAAILIGACAVEVPVPKPAPLTKTDRLLGDPNEIARALRPSQVGRNGVEEIPFPDTKVAMPRAGETNAYEIRVTPALEAAYDAILAGDGPAALAALERAEFEVQDPLVAWHISALRAQTLTMMGQAADAEIELERTSRLEIAWSGSNLNALALRGEARIWLEDYEGAIADYVQVVAAIGDWRLPTSYSGPPTNLAHVVATATAQLRAFTGLGIAHLLTGDNETALAWTAEAERGFNDVHYVAHDYSAHLPVHLDSWLGRAFNLAGAGGRGAGRHRRSGRGGEALRYRVRLL